MTRRHQETDDIAKDKQSELKVWQDERVREGVRAAEEGRFVSTAEMTDIFGKYKNA